jgi:hypothetical protein
MPVLTNSPVLQSNAGAKYIAAINFSVMNIINGSFIISGILPTWVVTANVGQFPYSSTMTNYFLSSMNGLHSTLVSNHSTSCSLEMIASLGGETVCLLYFILKQQV